MRNKYGIVVGLCMAAAWNVAAAQNLSAAETEITADTLAETEILADVQGEVIEEKTLGLSYTLTQEMKDLGIWVNVNGLSTSNQVGEIDVICEEDLLASILVMNDVNYESYGGTMNAFEYYQMVCPEYEFTEEEHEGYHYITADIRGWIDLSAYLDDKRVKMEAAMEQIPVFLESITYIPLEKEALTSEKVTFQTMNLDGEEVTDEILSGKDISIVNVWATFCNPCINEMPDLAAWEKELPDNVQILYLCSDVSSLEDSNAKIAEVVTEKSEINRKNVLLNNDGSFLALLPYCTAVPTTFFIDKDGQLFDEMIVGANIDGYKSTLEKLLNED